jgi:hypothetical protein
MVQMELKDIVVVVHLQCERYEVPRPNQDEWIQDGVHEVLVVGSCNGTRRCEMMRQDSHLQLNGQF